MKTLFAFALFASGAFAQPPLYPVPECDASHAAHEAFWTCQDVHGTNCDDLRRVASIASDACDHAVALRIRAWLDGLQEDSAKLAQTTTELRGYRRHWWQFWKRRP